MYEEGEFDLDPDLQTEQENDHNNLKNNNNSY